MLRNKSKKFLVILIAVMIFACVLASLRLKYLRKDWRTDHVSEVSVEQEGSVLDFEWSDIKSDHYKIEISKEGEKIIEEDLNYNKYSLTGIDYQKEYEITVYGKNRDGELVKGESERIYSRLPQEIETEKTKVGGHTGDRISLSPKAEQRVSCVSDDEEIATVDEEGNVQLHKEGKTKISLSTEGSKELLPETSEIEVICFPEKLDTPKLSLKRKSETEIVLSLSKSEYADNYLLERRNNNSDEYKECKTISANEFVEGNTTELTLAKDTASYRVKAMANAGDEILISDPSEEIEIASELEKAATYSSIKVISELREDDIERIIITPGGGGANLAQSMCSTGDGYVICFVNRGNSIGRLEKYNDKGELIAVNESAGHLGHANGCTYDPKTNSVYVMKTYASANYNEIRAFDSKTLESKDSAHFAMSPSGIGYDAQMEEFYMTASGRIYITDEDLNLRRTIYRKRAYRSQDVCGYNGIVMSCIWTGGSGSYIDMYNESNGDYMGSIYAPFGEIESACVEDGRLIMLYNGGSVYKTKMRQDFPG